jgi:outer membrane protein TolC
MRSRILARESLIQSNEELLLVSSQVRNAYCNTISNRDQIDTAAIGVKSAEEALREATIRMKAGEGTSLELIKAQRSYVNAMIAWAQSIVASNLAQAQLLHDTGLISIDTLTNGYKGI